MAGIPRLPTRVGVCRVIRRAAAGVVGLVAVVLAGCGLGDPEEVTTVVTGTPPAVTYVAIGGDESAEEDPGSRRREGWPRIVFREHLPPQTVFTNLARVGATAEDALATQLPAALALRPTIATVWLGVGDIEEGTPADAYQEAVAEIVTALDTAGTQVVVLSEPSMPSAYQEAIANLVAGRRATLLTVPTGADQDAIAQLVADIPVLP